MSPTTRPVPLTGRALLGALAVVALATIVVPPGVAWSLNQYRVRVTTTRAEEMARIVRRWMATSTAVPVAAWCGPGRRPQGIGGPTLTPEASPAGFATDAWGRCLLVTIDRVETAGAVWILSAGPNAVIDTPLEGRVVVGDDVGLHLSR